MNPPEKKGSSSPQDNPFANPTTELLETFFERVHAFPPDAQEFFSGFSSAMLEEDFRRRLMNNPRMVASVVNRFVRYGVEEPDRRLLLQYWNLPYPKQKK